MALSIFLNLWMDCAFLIADRVKPLDATPQPSSLKVTVMSLLIRYAHIPFYFRFSLTFPTSPIHPYAPPLRCDRTTIALTLSDRSRLFDGHMTYNSHVFTSILSVSNVPPPAVICLGRNKDLCSRRSKYKSYGALRGCDLGVRECLQVYGGK